jgi:hemerythrin
MQKFAWNESLSTGVRMIDTQHKELIVAINDLAEAIENGQGGVAIKKLLVFLKYYAEWHFDHEQQCAAKHQCPMAAVNEQAHAKFIDMVNTFHIQYRESDANEDIAKQIHQQLADWLVSHILRIDTQIGQCIQQAEAGSH